jgi:hypothetical protein
VPPFIKIETSSILSTFSRLVSVFIYHTHLRIGKGLITRHTIPLKLVIRHSFNYLIQYLCLPTFMLLTTLSLLTCISSFHYLCSHFIRLYSMLLYIHPLEPTVVFPSAFPQVCLFSGKLHTNYRIPSWGRDIFIGYLFLLLYPSCLLFVALVLLSISSICLGMLGRIYVDFFFVVECSMRNKNILNC